MRVRTISPLLWIAQVLLAALFLFAGGMKLTLPAEALRGAIPMPILFLRFLGVMEILGAIGLLLPGLLRIQRALTPLAGMGLMLIMTGATVITVQGGQLGAALVPFAAGLIAALVVYGRRDWLFELSRRSRHASPLTPTPHAGSSVRRVA
jgi:hypothetical protein